MKKKANAKSGGTGLMTGRVRGLSASDGVLRVVLDSKKTGTMVFELKPGDANGFPVIAAVLAAAYGSGSKVTVATAAGEGNRWTIGSVRLGDNPDALGKPDRKPKAAPTAAAERMAATPEPAAIVT